MQGIGLKQSLRQKLSPQQIQLIKLLQIPTNEIEKRIKKEIEENPLLEEGPNHSEDEESTDHITEKKNSNDEDINVSSYLEENESWKTKSIYNSHPNEEFSLPIPTPTSMEESLHSQLNFLGLKEQQKIIGRQIIGSIDADGYMRRSMEALVNDLAFLWDIKTNVKEVEEVLKRIQSFDPSGIAARNLKECLLLQLERTTSSPDRSLAIQILQRCYDNFVKKRYNAIMKKLDITNKKHIKVAIDLIIALHPKPGYNHSEDSAIAKNQYLMPDFILTKQGGRIDVRLNAKNDPHLKLNKSYVNLFQTYDKSNKKNKELKQTVSFVKQKLDSAQWFIEAIKQRQQTLLKTMNAIVAFQYDYFLEGDEEKLKPMILKNIAHAIGMDVSTISRVVRSKVVSTDFGIFPLKHFFGEAVITQVGEEINNRAIKRIIQKLVDEENKQKPLSDEQIESTLKAKGYRTARRTVAKYRTQLNIPVARLRKAL